MTRKEAIEILNRPFEMKNAPDEVLKSHEMAIKALEQEPCEDAISRQAVLDTIESWLSCDDYNKAERHIMRAMQSVLYDLPLVNPQEPKTGHWVKISPADIYECSECGQNVMTSDICAYKFCHGCGCRMVEPKERSE